MSVLIDKPDLQIDEVAAVARDRVAVDVSDQAVERIAKSRALVERWVAEERVIYGITTGFGALSDTRISKDQTRELQRNILLSHAAGVGDPLPDEVVRAIMAVRLHDISMGYAGVRLETFQQLLALLNAGICPVVPEKGSVGASGDLAPTSHLCLVLIGEGEAFYKGRRMAGAAALKKAGLKPITLEAGEGLALVNGTQVMTGLQALVVHDARGLAKMADIACAMSLEVLMGSDAEFDPKIHLVRPHPGQVDAADNMRRLTQNSPIIKSHEGCSRVQDAYTLRCSPQIHGATRDAIRHVKQVVEIEINSTTTNPLIFTDSEDFKLGGNFHGQPLALTADYLAMGLAELANISERRVERLVNPQLSELPPFLVVEEGLNSGFMIAQYTAAALVSENKVLAHPASVDSIPTSANKEDHVSMGTIAARQCRDIMDNTAHVIAVELLCAAQAVDLVSRQKGLLPGKGTQAAWQAIRKKIAYLDSDRQLSHDIEAMAAMVRSGEILDAVEAAVGELK
ncbi:MAG: histidine ammonia-lyase [Deltaproteobacteria bacterium]|jgi:histidine ammonia-lyase|nr:histidine ammonia-lyase [Deltaproteobacteria bacterium]MBW2480434.1 histidine ammonia-lyase [Deltaproteobacteria bacterium]